MRNIEGYLRQVGSNIKAARTRLGYRQTEVSEKSGITYRHYQNIEAGKVNVSLATLYRIAKLFKIKVEDLIKEQHSA